MLDFNRGRCYHQYLTEIFGVLRENAYLPFGFSLCEGFSAKSHFRGFQKPLSQ